MQCGSPPPTMIAFARRTGGPALDHGRAPEHPRRGFTLIELIISVAIMSVLLAGLASSVLVASRAMPAPNDVETRTRSAAEAVNQIAAGLAFAVSVSKAGPSGIEFSQERLGAATTVLYQWSGTEGDPLLCISGENDPIVLLPSVHVFTIEYDVDASEGAPPEIPIIDGPEELFLTQDSSNSGGGSQIQIGADDECALGFVPVLPADAVSFRISRVQFIGSPKKPAKDTLAVDVCPRAADGTPLGQIVETVLVSEADLAANSWHEVTFAGADGLVPTDGCAIRFRNEDRSGTCAAIKIGTGSFGSPETVYSSRADDISPFVVEDGTDLWLWVWGHAQFLDSDGAPPPDTIAHLRRAHITLQVHADDAPLRTSVVTMNHPLTTPFP